MCDNCDCDDSESNDSEGDDSSFGSSAQPKVSAAVAGEEGTVQVNLEAGEDDTLDDLIEKANGLAGSLSDLQDDGEDDEDAEQDKHYQ